MMREMLMFWLTFALVDIAVLAAVIASALLYGLVSEWIKSRNQGDKA